MKKFWTEDSIFYFSSESHLVFLEKSWFFSILFNFGRKMFYIFFILDQPKNFSASIPSCPELALS